jgi:branched-chain amino acid transport system ATP-binding protein
MAILSVDNLTLRFGGITAVDHLSFDIETGSITSLIGPNGAGKTSAFNCLTGFYKATEGEFYFEGKNITKMKPHQITRLGMSRTFQNMRLFKHMTVIDNVKAGFHSRGKTGIPGAILRTRKQRQEEKETTRVAEECLDFVGILDKKDRLATSLPYGDQRRVEWARALATQPKLLLLDEPAAGLNQEEKLELVELMKKIRSKYDITIFLIEHSMELVMEISEKIVVIDYGKKIAEGVPKDIANNPVVIEAYLGKEDDFEL